MKPGNFGGFHISHSKKQSKTFWKSKKNSKQRINLHVITALFQIIIIVIVKYFTAANVGR